MRREGENVQPKVKRHPGTAGNVSSCKGEESDENTECRICSVTGPHQEQHQQCGGGGPGGGDSGEGYRSN